MLDKLPYDIIHSLFISVGSAGISNPEDILSNLQSFALTSPAIYQVYQSSKVSILNQVLENQVGSTHGAFLAFNLALVEHPYTSVAELRADREMPGKVETCVKAIRNHPLIARLAHFVNGLREKDEDDAHGKLRFSEEYDRMQAETAVYIYATKGYTEELRKDIEEYCGKLNPPLTICSRTYTAMGKFIDAALQELETSVDVYLAGPELDDLTDEEYMTISEPISDNLGSFSRLIRKSCGSTGIWRILGYLRGAWGETTLDIEWIQKHEKLGKVDRVDCRGMVTRPQNVEEWYEEWTIVREDPFKLMQEWGKGTTDVQFFFGAGLECKEDYGYFRKQRERMARKDGRV